MWTSELTIRPGANDHQVIAELLAPGPSSTLSMWGPPISRILVDAHLVKRLPLVAEAAASVGIPFLIDPDTHFLQTELRPGDAWSRLPFGQVHAITPADLATPDGRDDLVDRAVSFQVEAGGTGVIAPYVYAGDPDDPWFDLSLDLLRRTAAFMQMAGIRLPLIGVLCGQLQSFGAAKNAGSGV